MSSIIWRSIGRCLIGGVLLGGGPGEGMAQVAGPRRAAPGRIPVVEVSGFEPEIRRQVEAAHRAVVAQSRDAEAHGRLGMILQAYERYEQSALFLAQARSLAPRDFRWAYHLGVVRAELGPAVEAVEALRAALEIDPGYYPARLRLAEALLAAGEITASRELYEVIRRERPDEAVAHYGLGRVAMIEGQREVAVERLGRAIELFPEYGAAHYAYGMVQRDQGRMVEARRHLGLSQEYRLKRPLVADRHLAAVAELNLGATLHLTRGRALEAAGRIEESIREHERALTLRPGLAQAHVNLITLYGRSGKYESALGHYRAAMALNPDLPDLHYNYGVLLVAQGETRRAAEAFSQALRLNPFHAESNHNYGVIIEQEGRLDEAAEHYRRALREKPGYRSAHFHLGRILVNQGRVSEGLGEFQRAVEPPPALGDEEAPGHYYALGATWALLGERPRAIAQLREAVRRAEMVRQAGLAEAIRRDLRKLGAEPGGSK